MNIFHVLFYQPVYNFLIFIVSLLPGHSVTLAILILTVIVRLALLPTSLKAAHLQAKNLKLQPKINKLRAEIKNPQEQSKALMELKLAMGLFLHLE